MIRAGLALANMTAIDSLGPARGRCAHGAAPFSLPILLFALVGCGSRPADPVWISLARGFQPRPLSEVIGEWERAAPMPSQTEVESKAPGARLRRRYEPKDWEPTPRPHCFSTPLPSGAFSASGVLPKLVGQGQEYARVETGAALSPGEIRVEKNRLTLCLSPDTREPPATLLRLERASGPPGLHAIAPFDWKAGSELGTFWIAAPSGIALDGTGVARLFAEFSVAAPEGQLAPYEYRVEKDRIVLCWPEDTPPTAELIARLENGRAVEGQWQLRLDGHCATGIPVWSGGKEEVVVDLPPESQLTFRFTHASLRGKAPVRARVRLDGTPLFERELSAAEARVPVFVAVPLPAKGGAGRRLSFEVEGAPGLGAFFTPTVGPLDSGALDVRPLSERGDIVLFLVDTLRADSLALSGGAPDLAPNLNRFAEECLRFPRARSNAAWTLPSISSLMTGLHPGQHGATDEDRVLSAFHRTIAEELQQAGYRTGAITDGSFFSPVFGLDQGFEWFSHHDPDEWDLDVTLREARAFLEEDDGRPVFLVVHTYRVHQPYRVGPNEDRSAYDSLMARAEAQANTDSFERQSGHNGLVPHESELRALYEAGVRDLDRGFGEFLAALERVRFFERGTLVVTSDHGEALGENADFFHGGHLWETKLFVPLLLKGPGIEPRSVLYPAGPIDLAPTFAELARIPPDSSWVGSSLLRLETARPSFAFQLSDKSRQVAILDGHHKVILTPESARFASGDCEEAFDLAEDAGEEHNLTRSTDWPGRLVRRLAPELLEFLEPRAAPEQAGVSAELRRQLDDLGYGGDAE